MLGSEIELKFKIRPLFNHTLNARFIDPVTVGLLAGGAGLAAGSMFGGSKKVKIPPQVSGSLQWLYDLLQRAAPTIPTRQIAGMTGTEQTGQDILADFAGSGMPEGYTAGMGELNRILSGEYDPRTSDFYKGFRQQSEEEEELSVNALNRGMQKRGMFSSSPAIASEGRLRKGFAGQRQQLLGSLFETERNKMFAAISPALEYGRFETNLPLTKMGAISQFDLSRNLNQQQLDAAFNQIMETIMFDYNKKTPVAGAILGANVPVQGPDKSMLSQIMPLLQSLLMTTAFMPGSSGGSTTMNAGNVRDPASLTPGWGTNSYTAGF